MRHLLPNHLSEELSMYIPVLPVQMWVHVQVQVQVQLQAQNLCGVTHRKKRD
jgi:hypothetical protein